MRISQAESIMTAVLQKNLQMVKEGKDLANKSIIPTLEGPPGCAKTAIVNKVAKELGATVIPYRLGEVETSDIAGWNLPNKEQTKMTHIPPRWLPEETGDAPVIVFFDEYAQGQTSAQCAISQCINERIVGAQKVPDNIMFVLASNGTKHRAGTNPTPTHLRDRIMYLEIEPHVEDTVPYFQSIGVEPVLCAYLRFRSEMLSQFDRDAKACPSPRSWERVNTALNCGMSDADLHLAIAGTVGDGAASDFMGYRKLAEAVPDMDELIRDPDNAPMPERLEVLYAVVTELVARFTTDNAANICKYLKRVPKKDITAFAVADLTRQMGRAAYGIEPLRELMADLGKMLRQQ